MLFSARVDGIGPVSSSADFFPTHEPYKGITKIIICRKAFRDLGYTDNYICTVQAQCVADDLKNASDHAIGRIKRHREYAERHPNFSAQQRRGFWGCTGCNQMVYKRFIDMQTKENAAALAVFSSHTVTRRACGGRSTSGGVFAPPFTLPIHMDCGPMPSDRTDCIPVSGHL